MRFRREPPLPITIAFWLSRSTRICWRISVEPSGRSAQVSVSIAAAYAFYWLRGWFKGADESKRLLAETHWRSAMRILDSMSYLRGAAMKVGQMLANFPDIAPAEFVQTLEKLHFNAPPMHW